MRPGPDFIIIGAMKCATSTLHEQLARQPGCFMSRPKEPCFFSDDAIFERGAKWYGGLFEAAPADAVRGESSTHYTKLPTHPHTVPRMRAQLPDVKLIYVMRHPLDRLVSHYIHEWSQGNVREPLERAVGRHPELVSYGLYARQLRPFLEAFGPERLLPVFFEQLAADPQAGLERIARFVGLPARPLWHPNLERQNPSRQRMRRSPLRDALLDAPVLGPLRRRLVPRRVRDRVKRLWTLERRPELGPERRAELEAAFDADLAELGRWLGRELRCGDFPRLPAQPPPHWTAAAPRPSA